METWNHHKLRLPGGGQQSPHQMFTFGMVAHGPRGVQHMVRAAPVDEEVEDPDSYGVDWEVHDDEDVMRHILENNPHDTHDAADTHPFATSATPYQLSDVPCVPPNCPLTPAQVQLLDGELAGSNNLLLRSESAHRLLWIRALSLCSAIMS